MNMASVSQMGPVIRYIVKSTLTAGVSFEKYKCWDFSALASADTWMLALSWGIDSRYGVKVPLWFCIPLVWQCKPLKMFRALELQEGLSKTLMAGVSFILVSITLELSLQAWGTMPLEVKISVVVVVVVLTLKLIWVAGKMSQTYT